jgi:hypothetical protein
MSAQHTRRVFLWLDQVVHDKTLPASAFNVAYVVAQHINEDTGKAFPGSDRIASRIAMSQATVIDMVRRLRANGHLGVDPGRAGRGHSNHYRMIVIPQPTEVSKAQSAEAVKPQRAKLKPRPTDMNYFTNHKGSDRRSLSLVDGIVTEHETDPLRESEREPANDAPLNPALPADLAKAKAISTELHGPKRADKAANTAGSFQRMVYGSEPIVGIAAHDYLPRKHQADFSLHAPSTSMGRPARANAGQLLDELGNMIEETETPPPKSRARTYAEAIYGQDR